MKKTGLMAFLLSALAFASCDNNELQNNQTPGELGVVAVGSFNKTTRSYTLGSKFDEVAFADIHEYDPGADYPYRDLHLSGWLTQYNGIQREYFRDKLYKKDASGDYWRNWENEKYDPIYWPIGGTMDFLSYSSTSEEGTMTVVWGENPADKVRINVEGDNYKNDILFASAKGVKSSKESGCVNLNFKHAQAWIEFVLSSDGALSEDAIKFVGLEINNIHIGGQLDIHNNNGDALAYWQFCGVMPGNVSVPNETAIEYVTGTPQYLDVLIPQQQQTSFTFYYQLGNSEVGTLDYTFELPSAQTWFMGKKYVYKIHYSANELTVTPDVAEWVNEPQPDIDLN